MRNQSIRNLDFIRQPLQEWGLLCGGISRSFFFHQLRRDPRNGQDFRTRESAYGISLCWAIRRRLSRRLGARLLVHGTPQSSQVDWLVASTGAKPTSLGRGLERPISYPSNPSVIIPQGCSFARGCEYLEVDFFDGKAVRSIVGLASWKNDSADI